MSFNNNNEDGDGLAALFGGITPQTPKPAADPARPAAAVPPVQQPPVQQPPVQQPPGQQAPAPYPTSAPPAYQAPVPGYQAPTAYPASVPGYQAPVPGYQVPPSYDLPAPAAVPAASTFPAPPQYPATPAPEAPPAAPSYPGLAPAGYPPAAPYPGFEQQPPVYPGLAPQGQPPGAVPYDLPAPVASPSAHPPAPLNEPPVYPGFGPAADPPLPAAYDLPAPAASFPPAYEPPAHQPPVSQPPSSERSAAPPDHEPPAAPPAAEAPVYAATSAYETMAGAQPGYERPAEPPVRADVASPPVFVPAGPLLPSTTAAVVTPEDIERATAGERVVLGLAILTGPIGLIVAIISAIRGARRRGWVIGIARVSLVLAVLSTIAAVIAGVILWNIRVDQIQHAELAAASAEFCAAAEADPSMVVPPTLGWPSPGHSIAESLETMTAWTTRWTELAATSPAKLRTGMELLAAKGQTIIDAVTTARLIEDPSNKAQIASIEAQSGVADWYTNYCVTP